MITAEIIVFVLGILFGIVLYWSESKSNRIYRFINHLTHNEELQMKPENRKGFIHKQPFLLRLVYISLLFVLAALIISFATPIGIFVSYFVSAIVATLIGSYIASIFLFASERTKKEALQQAFEKGKDQVEEFMDDVKENFESPKKEEVISQPKSTNETETPPKKSARDRFKDKGMIK